MSTKLIGIRRLCGLAGLAFAAVAAASCGDVVRTGRSPDFLVINSLQGAPGNKPAALGNVLQSDVLVNVTSPKPCAPETPCPTIFNDVGSVTFGLAMKDVSVTPTSNNAVTISRYHVSFRRSDGRNTQGVDVPWAFDGAATVTIPAGGTASLGFELVRHTAKGEAPLAQLVTNPNVISTIAEVIFYGRDQVGNDISVAGTMLVDFGNFGDIQ